MRDRRTDTIYQWPSPEIVSQAQRIGFNLVPVGFVAAKTGRVTSKEAKEDSVQWRV